MQNDKELIERVEDLEGTIEGFRALLTLMTIDLEWSNTQIRAFLRASEDT